MRHGNGMGGRIEALETLAEAITRMVHEVCGGCERDASIVLSMAMVNLLASSGAPHHNLGCVVKSLTALVGNLPPDSPAAAAPGTGGSVN